MATRSVKVCLNGTGIEAAMGEKARSSASPLRNVSCVLEGEGTTFL
jgi:hypothetical protein